MSKTAQELVDFIAQYNRDPLGYVQAMFPWGEGELEKSSGPRQWQADIFKKIGEHLQNPETRFHPLKIAVASGHGVGKSAFLSMLTQWGLSTFEDCKIVVTANTENQLRTKTWPELGKWFRLAINKHWFNVTATSIYSTDKEHESEWRANAVPWSENNTESFAGLHNKGKRIILIMDEGSSIHERVFDVAEGAMTDENTEIIWLVFGNPTRNSGKFRELFGKLKHRWLTRQIDSSTVEGTNKELFKQWEDDYGHDSDFYRVRVRGEFPRAGNMQFISGDLVEDARRRPAESKLYDPCVLGCDIARFGDDSTVICLRRGKDARTVPWVKLKGADTMTVAARIMQMADEHKPDVIMVDGGGVGGGVIDRIRMFNYPVIEVQFGAAPDRSQSTNDGPLVYLNKRAEMWGNMRDWLRGGAIPDDPDLASQLTGLEYGYTNRGGLDAIQLEKKSDLKKRGLASPDDADALAITFAYPVVPRDHTPTFENRKAAHQIDYNPLSRDHIRRG